MADKINLGGLIIGATAAAGALIYLRPQSAVSESGGVNYQNIAVAAVTGGVLGYYVSDKIEDLNPVGKLVDGAKKVAAVPGRIYKAGGRGIGITAAKGNKVRKVATKKASKLFSSYKRLVFR